MEQFNVFYKFNGADSFCPIFADTPEGALEELVRLHPQIRTAYRAEHILPHRTDSAAAIKKAARAAAKAASLAEKLRRKEERWRKIIVDNPTGTWAGFAAQLCQTGYELYLECPAEDVGKHAEAYAAWTKGEGLNEECVFPNTAFEQGRAVPGWRLRFTHHEDFLYPAGVPVSTLGTNNGRPSKTPRFLSDGNRIRLDYQAAIEELIKAGLRMNNSGCAQEVRVSAPSF